MLEYTQLSAEIVGNSMKNGQTNSAKLCRYERLMLSAKIRVALFKLFYYIQLSLLFSTYRYDTIALEKIHFYPHL